MKVLAGCFVEIDATKMMFEILKVVIFPMLAGGIVHRLLRRQFDEHKAICDRVLSVLSMAGICYTILALTAPSRDTFASAGALLVVAMMIHNTIGYLCGYWTTRAVGPWTHLGETEARTIAIEVGAQADMVDAHDPWECSRRAPRQCVLDLDELLRFGAGKLLEQKGNKEIGGDKILGTIVKQAFERFSGLSTNERINHQ